MSEKDILATKLYDLFSSLNDEGSGEEIEKYINHFLE